MANIIIEEILSIKSDRKSLREFGLTVGGVLIILGLVALWRGKQIYPYFISIGSVLVIAGLSKPDVLKPLQKAWMALAVLLGFLMSRVVLFALFFLVVTPIGFIIKITGKDILDRKIEKSRMSYWITRPRGDKAKESYENQY